MIAKLILALVSSIASWQIVFAVPMDPYEGFGSPRHYQYHNQESPDPISPHQWNQEHPPLWNHPVDPYSFSSLYQNDEYGQQGAERELSGYFNNLLHVEPQRGGSSSDAVNYDQEYTLNYSPARQTEDNNFAMNNLNPNVGYEREIIPEKEIIGRSDKMNTHHWQVKFHEWELTTIYTFIFNYWVEMPRQTARSLFDNINDHIENNPHLAELILQGDEQTTHDVAVQAGPSRQQPERGGHAPKKAEIMNVAKFIKWITKINNTVPHQPGAYRVDELSATKSPGKIKDMVKVLIKQWNLTENSIKKRLKNVPKEIQDNFIQYILSDDSDTVAAAVSQLYHMSLDGNHSFHYFQAV